MLQSLLQPRENQRFVTSSAKMIGAMPAVAVRHERRRAEKRGGGGRRPSQLPLQLGRALDADATPSPDQHRLRNELYVCGKVAALHAVVGSLLLGIVVLVVGLVQLSPGAEAAQHRYYLMGAGAALMGTGILGAVLRCVCLHWYNRKFREEEEEHAQAHKNGVSVVESGHGHDHKDRGHGNHDKPGDHKSHEHKEKPKLKAQASVGKDVDLMKQSSAASDT
ncbi:uncharacterized protein LOC106142335 isoform X2 [Amyelois transitella]|uniref:uncharacterized protein LOC106142335 isoform X2 n=1 Tax=Amyelois transitella TaxID=680683 RepID=UPI0029902F2A|nr:uncharacterized protein LOC106142335 isoform X2 [Amyelois transitella]